jgi:hypothetical protein
VLPKQSPGYRSSNQRRPCDSHVPITPDGLS